MHLQTILQACPWNGETSWKRHVPLVSDLGSTGIYCHAYWFGGLNQGDRVAVHVNSRVHVVISVEPKVHKLGIFEV